MSFRTVEVEVKVKLTIKVDEGVEVGNVIDEMDYSFNDTTSSAQIENTEITDYKVVDSR